MDDWMVVLNMVRFERSFFQPSSLVSRRASHYGDGRFLLREQ